MRLELPERKRTAPSNADSTPYHSSYPPTPSIFSTPQPTKRKARASKRLSVSAATSRSSHSLPLTSDARLDHFLLAARKFGRQRVNSLTGIVTQPVAPTSSQGQAPKQPQTSGRGSKTKELHFKETPYSRLRKEQEKKDMEVNGSSHHPATGEFLLDSGQKSTVSIPTPRTPKRNGASPYSVKTPVPATATPTPTYATSTPFHSSSLMSSPIAIAGSSSLTGQSTAPVPDRFQFAPSQVYSFIVSPTASPSGKEKRRAPSAGASAPTDPSSAPGGGGRRALNSLFEAAKSMEVPEGSDPPPSTLGPKSNGKRKVAEPSLGAPSSGVQDLTTKRRKVASPSRASIDISSVEEIGKGNVRSRAGGGKGKGKGVEKVMSALDVLADQAAAATASSSSVPNEESSERLASNGKGNGGKAAVDAERMSEETMTTRRTRRKIVSPESGNRKPLRGSDSGMRVGEARIIALAPEVEVDQPRLASSIDQGLEIEPTLSSSPQPKDLGDRNASTRFQDVSPSALPRVTEPAVAHCIDQPPVNLDAEDGDQDDDAEGDDDEEEEMQCHDAKPPSRSRTPPPDPDGGAGFNPTSGTGGNYDPPGAGDEDGHEADADADGDIDANDSAPSGSVRRRENLDDNPASRRFAHYRLTPLQPGDHYYVQNTAAGHLFDSSTSSIQERCRNDHDCGSRGCDSHVRGFGSATKALRMDTRLPNSTLARDGSAGTHSFISLGGISTRVPKFHDGLPSPSTRSFGTPFNNNIGFERSRMNVFFLIPQVGCGVASEENTLPAQKRLLRDQIWEFESVKGVSNSNFSSTSFLSSLSFVSPQQTFRTCTYRSPSTLQLISSSTSVLPFMKTDGQI